MWRIDKKVKLGRGRPEQTCDSVVSRDLKGRGLTEEMAYDREEWRRAIRIPTFIKQGDPR